MNGKRLKLNGLPKKVTGTICQFIAIGKWSQSPGRFGDYLHLLITNIKQMMPVTIVPRCILSPLLRSSLIIFTLLLIPSLGHSAWFDNDWQYRKQVTIDDAMVPNNDQTNIPVLIYRATDNDLRDNAQSDGSDIVFTSSDETTQLSHEIEFYDNTNGNLVAWVKVPTLNSSGGSATDTILYMYYGDTDHATNGDQENITDVWSNNYEAVWHLNEGDSTAADFYQDSTANDNDGTLVDADADTTAGTGRVGGGINFNGDADYIDVGGMGIFDENLTTGTASVWFSTDSTAIQHLFGTLNTNTTQAFFRVPINFDPITGANDTGEIQFFVRSNPNHHFNAGVDSNTGIADGSLHHIALVWDKASTQLMVYIDGVSQSISNGVINNGTSFIAWDNNLILGGVNFAGVPQSFLDGNFDEMRFSNVERDADWILTQYRNQSDYFAGVPMNYVTLGAEVANASSSTTSLVDSSGTDTSTYTVGSNTLGSIYVSVTDIDENTNASGIETVSITISSALTSDSESLTLTETGVNTGIFNNLSSGLSIELDNPSNNNNSTLETRSNDTITASYTDNDDGSDTSSDTATINSIDNTFSITLDLEGGNVSRGDILQGTLSITNMKSSIIQDTDIVLSLPQEVRLVENSYSVTKGDASITTLTRSSRDTYLRIPTIGANSNNEISFRLLIGQGVVDGETLDITIHTDNG